MRDWMKGFLNPCFLPGLLEDGGNSAGVMVGHRSALVAGCCCIKIDGNTHSGCFLSSGIMTYFIFLSTWLASPRSNTLNPTSLIEAMSKMVNELHVTRYFRLYGHYLHWEVRQSKAGIANEMEMNVSPRLLLMMLPLTYMHAHTQVLTHTHTRLVVVFVQSFRDFPEFFFAGFGSYILTGPYL